ncbi:SdiA-regulated domain-containing protein [uncultured Winogradskyella sp.]|uniref:SdiA-regulated domain-containing protein n=1 Tax=Winogradskyella sp. 4-2091 TaxID=3381659 RepID=UPI002631F590|nr:SdiA-regulated domain-containing protein [uncultured Winogradskyella sp.]
MKSALILSAIVIVLSYFASITYKDKISEKSKNNLTKVENKSSSNYTIKNTYKLPKSLNEISGIVWLSSNMFACVEDESGTVFIYNTKEQTITKEIKFAGKGDYEAIAINDNDAYILRSDGLIYEVKNYDSENLETSKIATSFKQYNNMESLTLDRGNDQLLITPKDYDFGKKHIKSIYKIPLSSKKMDANPIINIDLKANILEDFKKKKIRETLSPSDIAVHPKTKDIYVIDGRNPKLLILNSEGEIKDVFELDKHKFAQPEGITFSTDGRLFISNEANKEEANILEVELK